MSTFKEKIRRIGFVKKLRVIKWKKRARAELFSKKEVMFLEKNPDRFSEAIRRKLAQFSDGGQEKLIELESVFQRSPMANCSVEEALKTKEDMLFWHLAYGFTFNEYASYQFSNKTYKERRSFLSDRDSACLCYDMNDLTDRLILADKVATYEFFKQYYRREAIVISTKADYDTFLAFVERNPRFVKKDPMESCGRSVEMVDLSVETRPRKELFEAWCSKGKTILEEIVVQSKDMQAFNETSVNTLRCITFNTKHGVVASFFFFKTGRRGSFVDNGAAGGLIVAVDWKTGVLGTATDECGNRYAAHPDSGVVFEGFQLPDWEQARKLCCEMSSMLPRVRIIGWDLAHTDNGWVVIEGNSMTEAIGPQSTWLKGIRKDVDELIASV